MKIFVGSMNPVKVEAVREVFEEFFDDVKVVGEEVGSGVSRQPFGDEVIRGAEDRARKALKLVDADYGVGIEGGIMKLGNRWYNLGFVVIINREGKMGTGTSGWFECSPSILEKLKKGKELGEVIDELTGRKDTKMQEGAIGLFTKGKISRKDLYKHGVFMALIPFIASDFFR